MTLVYHFMATDYYFVRSQEKICDQSRLNKRKEIAKNKQKMILYKSIVRLRFIITLSPGMFLADMVRHLPVSLPDVVLRTIYPKKGAQCCCGCPAYDTKHFTLSITRPSSQIERRIKTINTITEPSFGVVISTISH